MYLNFFAAFKGDRGEEAFSNFHISTLPSDILLAIKNFLATVNNFYMNQMIFIILFASIIIISSILNFISKSQKITLSPIAIINFACLFWIIFILVICPRGSYSYVKYTASMIPLLCLLFPLYKKSLVETVLSVITAVVLFFGIIPLNSKSIETNAGSKPPYLFLSNESVPVVIEKNGIPWMYEPILPIFLDNQEYYFVDTYDDILNLDIKSDKIWLLQKPKADNFTNENFIIEKTGCESIGYGHREILISFVKNTD